MTRPRLIWGLDHPLTRVDSITDKDLWFGDRRLSPVRFDTIRLFAGDLSELEPWLKQGLLAPERLQERFYENMDKYLTVFDRTIFARDRDLSTCRDWFFLLFHALNTLLQQERPNYAFFFAPPHYAIDVLLSDLCEWLQIPIFWGFQSLFPNCFWILTPSFEKIPAPTRISDIAFPEVNTEKLFYMQNLKVPTRSYLSVIVLWLRILLGKQKNSTAYTVKKTLLQIQFQHKMKSLSEQLKTPEQFQDYLLLQPYVYVPLHLQPEMTTSALGGNRYHDQGCVIEDLLDRLPDGWRLLIKENPKQDWQFRSEAFWARIMSDSRVHLVPRNFSSKLIIEHSEMVAVISGTAGWEAIRMGKPVLAFGWCWYGELPGVFKYHPAVNLSTLAKHKIVQNSLRKEFQLMMNTTWEGIIDADYSVLVSNHTDKAQTPNKIAHLIEWLDTRYAGNDAGLRTSSIEAAIP